MKPGVPLCATALAGTLALGGCSMFDPQRDAVLSTGRSYAMLTPPSDNFRDLVRLPPPRGKIVASVYSFRDQTGQYKPAPDSSFSTAVTQGAGALLVKAMLDSQWFIPVEREGLQNLLTERRIVRALDSQNSKSNNTLAGLLPASILLEGGIVAYESNVRTGGAGAKYLGVGVSEQYRTDQVTVNLRAVDIRTGRVLTSVSTTKSVHSYKLGADVFKFVAFKELLEIEVGYTRNEPAQLCVQSAIEAAVIHLIVQGVLESHWTLRNPQDTATPIFRAYAHAQRMQLDPRLAEHLLREQAVRNRDPEY